MQQRLTKREANSAKITVVIPVLNESRTIGNVVKFALRDPRVAEVLVVDDGSIDGTPERAERAGARVVTSSLLGKGASMEDGFKLRSHCVGLGDPALRTLSTSRRHTSGRRLGFAR